MRYQAQNRYDWGWNDPRNSVASTVTQAQIIAATWESCCSCARDTPHLNGICIYDGEPTPAQQRKLIERFRTPSWATLRD